jgi:glycerophosphoryl diester phosphodiesterase
MEIKPDRGREVQTADVALTIARETWPASSPAPLISSFSRAAVAAAKELQPGWARDLLFDRVPGDWKEVGATLEVISFGANHQHLTAAQVGAMHEAGYGVMAYTVNDVDRAKTLKSWGVDGIFTDIPAEMLKAFK